jgi:hypothetical protein
MLVVLLLFQPSTGSDGRGTADRGLDDPLDVFAQQQPAGPATQRAGLFCLLEGRDDPFSIDVDLVPKAVRAHTGSLTHPWGTLA